MRNGPVKCKFRKVLELKSKNICFKTHCKVKLTATLNKVQK